MGVDSGQAGFYVLESYRNDDIGTWSFNNPDDLIGEGWYSACCDQTCYTDERAGLVPGGVVSSSGYGDGGYKCELGMVEGVVIAARILFARD